MDYYEDVISIFDDDDAISISDDDAQSTTSKESTSTLDFDELPVTLNSAVARNLPLRAPFVKQHQGLEFDRTKFPFGKLRVGDTVEVLDRDGDFFRIKHIIELQSSKEIFLRGWRFRRNSHVDGRITPTLLNEVTMLVDHDLDDPRPALEQGMETLPVTLAGKRRRLVITNCEFPKHSWREHTSFSSNSPGAEETKEAIRGSYELVCRWICIQKFQTAHSRLHYYQKKQKSELENRARLPLSATLRLVRQAEADSGYAMRDSTIRKKFNGRLQKNTSGRYTFADICCGAGFASLGAREASLDILYAVDNDANATATYRLNFPNVEMYNVDIGEFIHFVCHQLHGVHILHISFPCQAFSPANTRGGPNNEANSAASFALRELLVRIKPVMVTMEQTSGLLTHHPRTFQAVIRMMTDAGYSVSWSIENFANHGLAISRNRLLIVGACPGGVLPARILPTRGPGPRAISSITVAQALMPLTNPTPAQSALITHHNPAAMPRLDLLAYSPHTQLTNTITCGGTTCYHPSGLRNFTIRELACLQSAPLDFWFPAGQAVTAVKRQIGNAFPTVIARAVFESVIQAMRAEDARVEQEQESEVEF